MTKENFVEQVYLRITGGVLNDESSVQREDIEAYVPAAVNWAMTKAYNINLQEGDRDMPSMFYASFSDLAIDRTNRLPSISLPYNVVPFYGNQGLRYVTDNCGNTYTPLSDSDLHTIVYYKDLMKDIKFYRLKQNKQVDLYGLNPLIEKLSGEYVIRIDELEPTDELPIQAGIEAEAIDVCVQFFTGQRQAPGDKLNNKVDLNTAKQ